jgi:hypothetical protein
MAPKVKRIMTQPIVSAAARRAARRRAPLALAAARFDR